MEEKDLDQKAIRTYESDIANAIAHPKMTQPAPSQASIVIAAQEKNRKEEEATNVVVVNVDKSPKKRNWIKNILLTLISLILVAGGAGIAYYFYAESPLTVQQLSAPATTTANVTVTSIMTPDLQKVIDITALQPDGIISLINKTAQENILPNSQILEIVPAQQASTTQNGKTVTTLDRVTGPQFISDMGIAPPETLISSLTDAWMLGIYSNDQTGTGTTSQPFIILSNNFFQDAFAGMLSWESSMGSDLSGFFGLQASQWAQAKFYDTIVKNKDARELRDSAGNTLLVYSFVNSNLLVIAPNETVLGAIITRFENAAYVR